MAYDSNLYEDSEGDDYDDRHSTATEDYEDGSVTESEPPSNQQTPTTIEHPGIRHGNPPGLITQWTAEQCADFVSNLGFEQYADAVIEESIDGEALIAIQHGDLKDMGISSAGHRLTILKAVYQVKLKQDITIDPDHYVPLSADANAPDAHATQDDVARIINQIKLRDERILAAEAELRLVNEVLYRLQEEQRKFREDVLPAVRMAKDRNQPLPTPDGQQSYDGTASPRQSMQPEAKSSTNFAPTLTRKHSQKKNYYSQGKMPSPTIHETSNLEPSAAAMQASSHLTASMSSNSNQSSFAQSQQSPTSPPPRFNTSTPPTLITRNLPRGGSDSQPQSARTPNPYHEEAWSASQSSTLSNNSLASTLTANASQGGNVSSRRPGTSSMQIPNLSSASQPNLTVSSSNNQPITPGGTGSSSSNSDTNDPTGFMKSFRVSMEEPCHKVLPVALKKYHIHDDWRQYSLYIVHGDQERCLGLDERPLILFKQLASEGKKPMFMLRKHATPVEGFNTSGQDSNQGQQSAGVGSLSSGAAGVGMGGGGSGSGGGGGGFGNPSQQGRVQSYASSTMPLPGGVL